MDTINEILKETLKKTLNEFLHFPLNFSSKFFFSQKICFPLKYEKYQHLLYVRTWQNVRVVKDLVLKANGLCPREVKSRICPKFWQWRLVEISMHMEKKSNLENFYWKNCNWNKQVNKSHYRKIMPGARLQLATFGL